MPRAQRSLSRLLHIVNQGGEHTNILGVSLVLACKPPDQEIKLYLDGQRQ